MRIAVLLLLALLVSSCAKKDETNDKQSQNARDHFFDVKPEQVPDHTQGKAF